MRCGTADVAAAASNRSGTGPRVVLVGPPGAGKTSVGAALAQRWGTSFVDTDAEVERAAGKTVPEIFVDDGEAAFRAREEAAVTDALAGGSGVLALGGGAVVSATTRAHLRGHRVVFLDVGLAAAVNRVGLGVARPLVFGNVRAQLKALLDARRPWYAEVATYVVGTDGRTVAEVVDVVDAVLSEVPP
jgi:shikimate kinase